jgi:hypothetical protein
MGVRADQLTRTSKWLAALKGRNERMNSMYSRDNTKKETEIK